MLFCHRYIPEINIINIKFQHCVCGILYIKNRKKKEQNHFLQISVSMQNVTISKHIFNTTKLKNMLFWQTSKK